MQFSGGRGREAIGLIHEIRVLQPAGTVQRRVFGYVARGVVYLLIAIAAFMLVTLATSSAP